MAMTILGIYSLAIVFMMSVGSVISNMKTRKFKFASFIPMLLLVFPALVYLFLTLMPA